MIGISKQTPNYIALLDRQKQESIWRPPQLQCHWNQCQRDFVEVAIHHAIDGLYTTFLAESRMRYKKHGELTSINPVSISGTLKKVILVLELKTPCDTMNRGVPVKSLKIENLGN